MDCIQETPWLIYFERDLTSYQQWPAVVGDDGDAGMPCEIRNAYTIESFYRDSRSDDQSFPRLRRQSDPDVQKTGSLM